MDKLEDAKKAIESLHGSMEFSLQEALENMIALREQIDINIEGLQADLRNQ